MTVPIRRVCVNNMQMEYFCFGHGRNTMVILPGLSIRSVMDAADAVAQAYSSLTQDFTIYVFDRRKNLPSVYCISDMAQDTAAAIRALNLREICLFGASQGGMVAMAVAANEPTLVKKLALGSTCAQVDDAHVQLFAHWISLAKQKNGEALFLDFGKRVYPPQIFESSRALLIEAGKAVTDREFERFSILAAGTQGFSFLDRLDAICCPVLLIGAKDDAVLGCAATRAMQRHLCGHPGLEAYYYPAGFGHAAYDTAPDYKERLKTFFLSE